MTKEIANSKNNLKKGNIILYPTDTIWGIGCDATNEKAVQKIYDIKRRNESKSLIILVDSIDMLRSIINPLPDEVIPLLKTLTKPTSIIYNNPHNLAKNVIAKDNTVAVRIVQDLFCKNLIHSFGKPIVSTSANISGKETPTSFAEINDIIKKDVDYIVQLRLNETRKKASTILQINSKGNVTILRA